MSYLIAVATSDAKVVDLGFGAAKGFHIYEVEGTEYKEKEYREFAEEETAEQAAEGCGQDGQGSGCGGQTAGCGGNSGGGCGGAGGASKKVELIADCRSLVCQKIGFQAQKQLEKKAIAGFDVDCSVDEALAKIAAYFDKIDNHISLRRE
ncbi:Dinitrogenase iron-molybdenum cofactor [Butyrivibrio hungatei]|uniref:Dinitrogenase iron-molybdenum cofactor n=1 Tax=Butyrivibrio hungatei TaxID=185008 RepID=A0A1G5D0B2_9FIRM|nr:NifB/NifX family molybdenum-iron cluster-binding protein [Butyrivibrio hungatei]SCY08125.1 Dinitrogenase iron-molybdenum cofactor [Butyrivibrio hungatei]